MLSQGVHFKGILSTLRVGFADIWRTIKTPSYLRKTWNILSSYLTDIKASLEIIQPSRGLTELITSLKHNGIDSGASNFSVNIEYTSIIDQNRLSIIKEIVQVEGVTEILPNNHCKMLYWTNYMRKFLATLIFKCRQHIFGKPFNFPVTISHPIKYSKWKTYNDLVFSGIGLDLGDIILHNRPAKDVRYVFIYIDGYQWGKVSYETCDINAWNIYFLQTHLQISSVSVILHQ